jgi:hypothetical protein
LILPRLHSRLATVPPAARLFCRLPRTRLRHRADRPFSPARASETPPGLLPPTAAPGWNCMMGPEVTGSGFDGIAPLLLVICCCQFPLCRPFVEWVRRQPSGPMLVSREQASPHCGPAPPSPCAPPACSLIVSLTRDRRAAGVLNQRTHQV